MKKYLTIGNILMCCAALLALIALIVGLCAPAVSYTVEAFGKSSTTTYSGVQVAFGYTEKGTLANVEVWNFSFMNFLTYLLVLVGIVFAVLAILGKLDKISGIVAIACFLIAGIFFFCALAFSVPATDLIQALKDDGYALGAGAIVAGILSIISAVLVAVKAFVIKK